jgi:hypothetical protein
MGESGGGAKEMTIPSHLSSMVDRITASAVEAPPPPWRLVGGSAVGLLTDVGFARGSDLLLVVSSNGRGVFDCATGERIARDRTVPDADSADWQDCFELEAQGIGPLKGQIIRTAGLFGGGLPSITRDGWSVP